MWRAVSLRALNQGWRMLCWTGSRGYCARRSLAVSECNPTFWSPVARPEAGRICGSIFLRIMTAPALHTIGLHKSFGSLVVAQDVEITLPQGARYALIGPNGAGKTTLINLITGVLQPDKGQILLGDSDITALAPDRRVKRGLARTFQINTLFPDLEPLEAVTLAICEREGVANVWWRRLAGFSDAVDEAYDILTSLRL